MRMAWLCVFSYIHLAEGLGHGLDGDDRVAHRHLPVRHGSKATGHKAASLVGVVQRGGGNQPSLKFSFA